MRDIPRDQCRITRGDWELIRDTARGLYVEVGTFHGASATAAAVNADSVVTVDIYDWKPKVFDSDKITFFKGTSVDLVKEHDIWSIDVLFLDGSHEYDYVLIDCETLIPLVKPGGFILFHDYNKDNPLTGVYRAVSKYLRKVKHKKFPKVEGTHHMLKVQKL